MIMPTRREKKKCKIFICANLPFCSRPACSCRFFDVPFFAKLFSVLRRADELLPCIFLYLLPYTDHRVCRCDDAVSIKREARHDDFRLALACAGRVGGGTVGRSPVDRGKSGFQQITPVEANVRRNASFLGKGAVMKRFQKIALTVVAGVSLFFVMATLLLIAVTQPIYPFTT